MKKVIRKNGNLLLWVDGKEILPAAYMSYCPDHADYDGFREIGYRLFSYCIYAGDLPINEENGSLCSFEPGCWRSEEVFDFTPLDHGMERVLGDGSEEVYVSLRINLNMPLWWRKKYQEELIHYKNGRVLMQSIASEQWRQDACVYLRKLKEHIDASPYRSNIIGWQVAAMQTEEWIHPSKYRMELEKDLPLLDRYRKWCRKKYGEIHELNRAWESDYRDFDQLPLPDTAQLAEKDNRGSSTPAGRRVKEFHRCLNDVCGETISFYTRYVKELYHGDILCGAFTGYIGALQDFQGHSVMNRLLGEDSIDFFASPFAYVNQRGPAVDWIYHAPLQTVSNLGKLWFLESDVRTCLTKPLWETRSDVCDPDLPYFTQPVFFGPSTEEQSKANILRSFSKFFLSQHAFWWFDMWGGWYESEGFMALHRRLYKLYREKMTAPVGVENNTQLGVILDDNASYHISSPVFLQGVYQQLVELGYLGAPYDLLLLERMGAEEMEKYNLFLCLSPDQSSPAYLELKKQLESMGKPLLITGDGADSGALIYNREALRKAAEEAGVFLYSFGNIVYANENYIAVTATADGEVCLCLPRDGELEDLITGEVLKTENGTVRWHMESNLCRLLKWR